MNNSNQRKTEKFSCECGYECDNPFCIFEHIHGTGVFCKAALSALNNILVAKGVCTADEILDETLGVLQEWHEDEEHKELTHHKEN